MFPMVNYVDNIFEGTYRYSNLMKHRFFKLMDDLDMDDDLNKQLYDKYFEGTYSKDKQAYIEGVL